MQDLFERFTTAILKLNKLVQRIKVHEMKKFGLKSVHVMCLYYLNSRPRGITAGELARMTLEDKAAISRALAEMRQRGYVVYDPASHSAAIRLTEEGVHLAEYISQRAAAAVGAGSAQFTDEQREFFYTSLITISDNLESYYDGLIKNSKGNDND